MIFLVQPSNTAANTHITPSIVIQLDPSVKDDLEVSLSLEPNPGKGKLSGTLKRKAVNHRATFDDLAVSLAGHAYKLQAKAVGESNASSNDFNVI